MSIQWPPFPKAPTTYLRSPAGTVVLLALWFGLLFSTVGSLAHAVEPPEAIGSLFLKGEQKYLCTASAVAGKELGLEQELVLLTAAHCVDSGLQQEPETKTWVNQLAYEVSFDSQTFYEVYPYRVGFAKTGYDVAVLFFTRDYPEVTPLHMGSWDGIEFGSDIQNFANPLGMGIQYFTGAVTMMAIAPSPTNKKPQWYHNAVASVQVGPGSSGSLILNEAHEYIGVLSGVMEARFGSPFTIFIPQWRFEEFLLDEKAGRTLECDVCEQELLQARAAVSQAGLDW